jgi:hypothetical protein
MITLSKKQNLFIFSFVLVLDIAQRTRVRCADVDSVDVGDKHEAPVTQSNVIERKKVPDE